MLGAPADGDEVAHEDLFCGRIRKRLQRRPGASSQKKSGGAKALVGGAGCVLQCKVGKMHHVPFPMATGIAQGRGGGSAARTALAFGL